MRARMLIGAAAAALLAAGHAAAAPTYGAVSKSTYRDCSGAAAGAACDGQTIDQRIVSQVTSGGAHSTASSDLTLLGQPATEVAGNVPNDGSFARGSVGFGALDLPVIHGSTFSAPGSQDRMNTNSMGYQSYVYDGPDGTPFSLTGDLHIDDSSASSGDGTLPGGSIYNVYVAIWAPSFVSTLSSADDIFNNAFLAQCGTAGVLAVGMMSGPLSGGSADYSVTTTSCSGGPLTLTAGEEVLAVSGLQLPVNRGGFADASHTFTTTLGDDLSVTDKATLTANLVSGRSALGVPEPSTWALMLGGVFWAGAVLRRRPAAA